MRSFLIVLIAVLLSVIAIQFLDKDKSSAAESDFDRVMRTGTIRCGYYVFPPVTYRDPNTKKLSGFSVDIMEAIVKRADLKIEWTEEINFANWSAALQAGRFDMTCTPVWPEVQLGRVVLFSTPLMYAGLYPLIRADDEKLLNAPLERFNQKDVRFVTQDGNSIDMLTRSAFPNATINAMPPSMDGPTVLEEIVTGKSDAILLDKNADIMYNKHNPGTFVLRDDLQPLKIQPFPLAFDKGEIGLKLFIDNAISELHNNGEIDRILTKWEEQPGTFLRAAPPYKR